MIAFGPVPSRRLGRSVGINNIPPKICTYACVYCQLGRTIKMRVEREAFYTPEEIVQSVQEKVQKAQAANEPIDYLTFVPDGEPTLDVHLGREIELLKPLGIKIAVITNSSLVSREDVRNDLQGADWVSLKVDSVKESIWRKVDRPPGVLELNAIQEGMLELAATFEGVLVTETMLVEGVNDGEESVGGITGFLSQLKPRTVYLSIPTRPPAENWVHPPDEKTINRAFQIMSERLDHVEYLIGYEGNEFAFTGDVQEDLLSITAVHPMREDAVGAFLERANSDWEVVHRLVAEDELVETEFEGWKFYLRRLGPVRR
ncbi:MAG: radical SAM protein, partial [Spirochaetaceae bacterium]|nr:radical SAM protein [Spirochaetaceae bacterium]